MKLTEGNGSAFNRVLKTISEKFVVNLRLLGS